MSDSDRVRSLDSFLVGGRESQPIVIVEYDPGWVTRFEEESPRIRSALGERVRAIEHIGSTAVPTLAAKPIVDILVIVDDADDEDDYGPLLVAAGYEPRLREPGHRMYRTPRRDIHVHLYGDGAPAITDLLDLRDFLRVDEDARELYAATKRDLASKDWNSTSDYAGAKSEVVETILTMARRWRKQDA